MAKVLAVMGRASGLRTRRFGLGAAAALVWIAAAIPVASAGDRDTFASYASPANWASDASGNCSWSDTRECYPDSSGHTWDFDLGSDMLAATYDTLYNSYDTTELTITMSGVGNNGQHNTTVNVYYREDGLLDSIGIASCQSWNGHICGHWHVIYDYPNGTTSKRKSLACHETGTPSG
jgi:hypothetical protein